MFANMNNQSKTIARVGSAVVLIMSITSACGSSKEDEESYSRPLYPEVPLPAETIDPTEQPVILTEPQIPDHNYGERRGDTYYYIAAVSEEDKKRGLATGQVIAYQYLGTNSSGEHILANLRTNGTVSHRARCNKPCRIIDTDNGDKIAYSPISIIGSAFDDAFRGKLRIAQWAKNEATQSSPSATATPEVFSEADLEAFSTDTPPNEDNKNPPSHAHPTKTNEVEAEPIAPVTD